MGLKLLKSVPSAVRKCGWRHVSTAEPVVCGVETELIPKPYSEVPGPRPIPVLGNTWRLLPVIGLLFYN